MKLSRMSRTGWQVQHIITALSALKDKRHSGALPALRLPGLCPHLCIQLLSHLRSIKQGVASHVHPMNRVNSMYLQQGKS